MTNDNPEFLDYLADLETETSPSTKKQIDGTVTAVLGKVGLKRKLTGKKKIGRVLLIAAAVAVCAVVTAMAAGVNIGDMFRGCFTAFNPMSNHSESTNLTQGQLEVLNKTGTVVNQSVTSNGTTITIKAIAGDKHHALFLTEIDAAKGKILTDQHFSDLRFGEFSVSLPGTEDSQKGWSGSGGAVPEKSSNSKIAYLWEIQSSGLDLKGQEVKLVIKDIKDYKDRVTATGNWTFNFKLNFGDSKIKEIEISKTIRYQIASKSGKNTVMQCTAKTLKLSALSVSVDYSGRSLCADGHQQVPNWVIIHRRNGKDLFLPNGDGNGDSKKLTVLYQANEPLDLDNIVSVTIGDLTIPVT